MYNRLLGEFQRVLELAHLATRKQDGVYKRRKVTFHSFRRFVKTTIANQTRNSDFSEWFLGHSKSSYYTTKHYELKRIYKEECMKYLTFLNYPTVEATGRSYEAKLREKDIEIEALRQQIGSLRQRDLTNTERITQLEEQFQELLALAKRGLRMPPTEKKPLSSEQYKDLLKKELKDATGWSDYACTQEAEYLTKLREIHKRTEKQKDKG